MLLIDSGNSAIKTRLLQEGLCEDRVFPIHEGFAQSGFTDYLSTLDETRVYAASVASALVQQTLQAMIQQYLPTADYQQLHTMRALNGVTNAYTNYRHLGVDRWLTLMAATQLTGHDAVIIDAGSAITIDLLSRHKGHLGGAILPGFNTNLQRFKGLFPLVDFNDADIENTNVPGCSTAACINIKRYPVSEQAIVATVQGWQDLLKQPFDILLSGQDAKRISQKMTWAHQVIPDLVFIGMLKQIQCLG